MDREIDATKNEIVKRGFDDWVHISEIVSAAMCAQFGEHVFDGYPNDKTVGIEELRYLRDRWLASKESDALPLAIAAVKELLRDGLVRIGDTIDNGFTAWTGSEEEIESRIDSVVEEAEFPMLPGHLFWLENTAAGDKKARPLVEADRKSSC